MVEESEKFLCPFITGYDSGFLTEKNTGLGNVLFKLASTYAICKKTNRKLSNYHLKKFCIKLKTLYNLNHGDTIFMKFLKDDISSLPPNISFFEESIYDESIIMKIKMSEDKCISINSYLGYPLYFSEYREDILSMFSIPEDILKSLIQEYPDILNPSSTPVSLHMRLNQSSVPIDDTTLIIYYQKSISYIQSIIKNPKFFVFSDDIAKAKDIINQLIKEPVFIYNTYDYIDLYLISLCHHHITSASTFSWWGAYLSINSNKIIIYPRYYNAHESLRIIPEEQWHREYYFNNAIAM